MVRLGIHRNRTEDEEQAQTLDQSETTERTRARRPLIDHRRDRSEEAVERPAEEAPTPPPAPRWVHVSLLATLGLIVGLLSLVATLTGLLAPVGVALGVVGGAISAGGLVGASRRGVTGHSVALLGLLASIAAIVLGVLAIGGYLPWLDSRTDVVAHARAWLDARLSFLRKW